uniref:Uncharacterized protein n=1 Tax=Klebsiella pneumoniae TaxID=573 RepID=A0A2P1BN60_KLEPN|nr:hypothetical protein [Klebsiella pneumoniae]
MTSALRQLVEVALSSSRCVTDAKTVAVSLTDLPGLSTQPWPILIPSNTPAPTARSAWFSAPAAVPSAALLHFHHRDAFPPFRRVSGIFPSTARRSPLPPAVFLPEQRPLAVDRGNLQIQTAPSRSFRVSILLLAVTRSMTKRSCVRVSGSQRSITIPSR